MGAAGSHAGSSGADRLSDDQLVAQPTLPMDVMFSILAYIDIQELCRSCRFVCKAWRDVIDSNSFLIHKCRATGISIPDLPQNCDFDLDLKRICLLKPYDRNLIKNWNAKDNMRHWQISAQGGHGWAVEPDECHYADPVSSIGIPDITKCWVSSFGWCMKGQLIDLVKEGFQPEVLDKIKPTILASDFTAARKDCASRYTLEVYLKNDKQKTIDHWKVQRHEEQWSAAQWVQVMHKFENYPDGVRYVEFVHGGRDKQFWAGHYGPKFTGSVVRVLVNGSQLPEDVDTHGKIEIFEPNEEQD